MINKYNKQNILSPIFSKFPLNILYKLTGLKFIVGFYHVISDEVLPHIKHLYQYKNVRQFKADLDYILKNFSPITLHDLINHLKNGRSLPKKTFLLTFDDGFKEMYDIVAPILKEKGFPATFFVCSAFIDNMKLCYFHKASIIIDIYYSLKSPSILEKIKSIFTKYEIEYNEIKLSMVNLKYEQEHIIDEIGSIVCCDFNEYLINNKPYLTSSQIKSLINDGFTIGAHSIDHPLYSSLSLKEQLHQTVESVKQIKEKFILDYSTFAFPTADNNVSKKFFKEIFKNNFIDVSFGTYSLTNDCIINNIQRFSLNHPIIPANKIITYQFIRKRYRQIIGKDKIIRT